MLTGVVKAPQVKEEGFPMRRRISLAYFRVTMTRGEIRNMDTWVWYIDWLGIACLATSGKDHSQTKSKRRCDSIVIVIDVDVYVDDNDIHDSR